MGNERCGLYKRGSATLGQNRNAQTRKTLDYALCIRGYISTTQDCTSRRSCISGAASIPHALIYTILLKFYMTSVIIYNLLCSETVHYCVARAAQLHTLSMTTRKCSDQKFVTAKYCRTTYYTDTTCNPRKQTEAQPRLYPVQHSWLTSKFSTNGGNEHGPLDRWLAQSNGDDPWNNVCSIHESLWFSAQTSMPAESTASSCGGVAGSSGEHSRA